MERYGIALYWYLNVFSQADKGQVIKLLEPGQKASDHPITEADVGTLTILETIRKVEIQIEDIEKQIAQYVTPLSILQPSSHLCNRPVNSPPYYQANRAQLPIPSQTPPLPLPKTHCPLLPPLQNKPHRTSSKTSQHQYSTIHCLIQDRPSTVRYRDHRSVRNLIHHAVEYIGESQIGQGSCGQDDGRFERGFGRSRGH